MKFILSINNEGRSILSRKTLAAAIIDLHKASHDKPRLVQLIAEDGATMSIGVGLDRSVLNFISPSGWPAYTAIGDAAESTKTITFSICDEETEMSARFAMPFDVALAGLLEFFDTGHLPSRFDWAQD